MGFIKVAYTIPKDKALQISYARVPKDQEDDYVIDPNTVEDALTFVTIPGYIGYDESPYTIQGVEKGTYVIALKMYKLNCDTCCTDVSNECDGVQYFLVKSKSDNDDDGGDDNNDDNDKPKVTIEWGFFSSEPNFNTMLPHSFQTTSGEAYEINTTISTNVNWYIVKEPTSEPIKLKWENTALNSGTIPDQVWQSPVIHEGYTYYITRGKQAFQGSHKVKLYV